MTSYAYDLSDNITSMTYPSGRIVRYGRDALGGVQSVTTQRNSAAVTASLASNISFCPTARCAASPMATASCSAIFTIRTTG